MVITDALGFGTTTDYDALIRPITVSDTIGLVKRTTVLTIAAFIDTDFRASQKNFRELRRKQHCALSTDFRELR